MAGELHNLSASELIELYRSKKASPVDAAKSVLQQIDKLQPTYNAFCVIDQERTLEDARASEDRWNKGEEFSDKAKVEFSGEYDYSFFIWGLIEMYELTFNPYYLQVAIELSDYQIKFIVDKIKRIL